MQVPSSILLTNLEPTIAVIYVTFICIHYSSAIITLYKFHLVVGESTDILVLNNKINE